MQPNLGPLRLKAQLIFFPLTCLNTRYQKNSLKAVLYEIFLFKAISAPYAFKLMTPISDLHRYPCMVIFL